MKEKKTKTIKKDYKKALLAKVHLRVITAIALGQFTCGFSLGITGVAMNSAAKYIQISNMWTGLIGAGGVWNLYYNQSYWCGCWDIFIANSNRNRRAKLGNACLCLRSLGCFCHLFNLGTRNFT